MGLLLNNGSAPSLPAAGKQELWTDSSDRKPKILDEYGVLKTLANLYLPNYLRNSGMWFAQRQAPGTLTTYSNTTGRSIAADGWGVTNENTSVQYIRVDSSGAVETGLQSRFYGTFSKITTTGKIVLSHVIEGQDACQIRGRTVRFQVQMKASAAKTIKIGVVQNAAAATIDTIASTFVSAFGANTVDPTLGANLSWLVPKTGVAGDNCTATANNFSCAVTTAWQRFGGVVDVPTNCKNLIVVIITDSQFAAADSVSITQASLTDGYEIQDWSPLPYQQELERCQRFYCKTFNVDVLPAASVGALTGESRVPSPVTASTAFAVAVPWLFPVRMRIAPTVAKFNPAAAGVEARNQTLNTDCTSTSISANGEAGCVWGATTPGSTVTGANIIGLHITADAEI